MPKPKFNNNYIQHGCTSISITVKKKANMFYVLKFLVINSLRAAKLKLYLENVYSDYKDKRFEFLHIKESVKHQHFGSKGVF